MFRSPCVKPYVISLKTDSNATVDQGNCTKLSEACVAETELKQPTNGQKVVSVRKEDLTSRARVKDIRQWNANRAPATLDVCRIDERNRIFGSRFVDSIKHGNAGVRYNSRLVAQNYGDEQSASIASKARTVQRLL